MYFICVMHKIFSDENYSMNLEKGNRKCCSEQFIQYYKQIMQYKGSYSKAFLLFARKRVMFFGKNVRTDRIDFYRTKD